MRIILEGGSGSGKSTLLGTALRDKGFRLSGVFTARVLGREGERLGFSLYPASELESGDPSLLIRSVNEAQNLFLEFRGGKPLFHFDTYLASFLAGLRPSADLLVIDEFGGLELLDDAIYAAFQEAFNESPHLILCLKSEKQLEALAARAGLREEELRRIVERRNALLKFPEPPHLIDLEKLGHRGAEEKLLPLLSQLSSDLKGEAGSAATSAALPIHHGTASKAEALPNAGTIREAGENRPREAVRSPKKTRPGRRGLWILAAINLVIFLYSFTLGHYPLTLQEILQLFLSRIFPSITSEAPSAAAIALFNIRLPRLILASLVGGGLSLAGASFQAVFRNPLVSPNVLGASQGAAFGAALAILLGLSSGMITALSFLGGMLSILIVLLMSRWVRMEHILSLVLTGLVVGSLASASLSLMKLLADPQSQLPAITYWLMGSLASARLEDLPFALPCLGTGSAVILLLRWKLNLLTLSEEEGRSMGLRVREYRIALILAATLVTAASVSVSGMIGWIGLVIPHAAALLFGADYRRSLPASFFLGASFTLAVDNLARILTSSEIPLGILTSFIGAPAFLLLMLREGRSRERSMK